MPSKLTVTESELKTLNMIRDINYEKHKDIAAGQIRADKKTIAEKLSISVAGVSSIISKLLDEEKNNPCPLKNTSEPNSPIATYEVNEEVGYFLGISIGSLHIKLRLIDFAFNEVDVVNGINKCIDTDCEDTPFDFMDNLKSTVNKWIEKCVEKFPNIRAVCIAFPGFVDPIKKTVLSTPNIHYINFLQENSLISSALSKKLNDLEIEVFFQHAAKTALIAEKVFNKQISLFDDPNVACYYMGTGISIGLSINNALYMGNSNFAGEYGHTKLFGSYDQYANSDGKNEIADNKMKWDNTIRFGKCGCGQFGCFEQILRKDVFDCATAYDFGDKYRNSCGVASNSPECEAFMELFSGQKFAYYLGLSISNLMNMFSFNKIVFAGILNNVYEKIGDNLEIYTSVFCNSEIKPLLKCCNSECKSFSTAMGAAIYAYYKYFDADVVWGK